ncbi:MULTISPECIES: hypothetical protein [unclassified Bradyrhizobium]|uniref:hypothetical protein n=1 Tax=unclassified Bradyrhizobium TaxID=2631580 RepID=UPI0028EED5AA|nr:MULTISPECIES: hypothetical protein [unclassified Bradyrhizobium]
MEFNRRSIGFGAVMTEAVTASPLPPLRASPPLRGRPSGIRYRFNDGTFPSTVFDILERSDWHVQSDPTAHVIRHLESGLTFTDPRLLYDPHALELLHCFEDAREVADEWRSMLIGWAALNVGWNVRRQRPPGLNSAFYLSPSRQSRLVPWLFDYAEAPPLVAVPFETAPSRRPDIWLHPPLAA